MPDQKKCGRLHPSEYIEGVVYCLRRLGHLGEHSYDQARAAIADAMDAQEEAGRVKDRQVWFCDVCGSMGVVVVYGADADVISVSRTMRDAHNRGNDSR